MNLARLLEKTAEQKAHQIGLRYERRDWTFEQLLSWSKHIAGGLIQAGLKKGDRCILMMPSTPEFVVSYYALAAIGATVIPVNFLYKSHELQHILTDSGAQGFIGMAPYLDEARKVLSEMPEVTIRIAAGITQNTEFLPLGQLSGPDPIQIDPARDEDTAAILYTSGTTGKPKGAMLSHGNLCSNAMTVADMRQTDPADIVLGVLPLYHIYGQTSVLNASIYLGLTLHLFEAFNPATLKAAIEATPSTILFAVPTIFSRLLSEAQNTGLDRSSLRFCVSGGASLPVALLNQFESRYQTRIYEGYGLTECSPVCVENPFGKTTKPGSIGLPIPGFQARIVDESGTDLEDGQVGELLVKGPGVMKGYLNQPEATARSVVKGWLHTGDLARRDDQGYIFIIDRKKDCIIRGGYNVYPREVEEVLFEHPEVVEAGVFGLSHEELGEEIVAEVVLKPGAALSEDQLRRFVKDRLAPYKYPRIIRFVRELPKSHTGKVLKRDLRKKWNASQTLS